MLLLLGTVEAGLLGALAWWPGLPLPAPGFLLFAGAFTVYALAGWAAGWRAGGPTWPVWVVALLIRGALLPVEPELSDDHWRYLWDGHVQLHGVNPYLHPPADPALDGVETGFRDRVNHPEVHTIYPPVAQGAFLLVAWAGGGILGLKLLWMAFDLAGAWLLGRAALRRGRDPRRPLLLWLWSPLLLVETAWNGHLEPLGLAGVAALLAWGHRPAVAGLAAGWATLVKLVPAAAVPPVTRRLGPRFLAGFVAAAVIPYLPYVEAGPRLVAGLGTYARDWRFNEGAFALLEAGLPTGAAARMGAAGIVAVVVMWATLRRWDAERSLRVILATGLVLSPTLHPWYVLWILPLAALGSHPAWIALTGTAFVGYFGLPTFLDSGNWPQPLWGRAVLWGPVLLLLAIPRRQLDRAARRAVPGLGGAGPGPGSTGSGPDLRGADRDAGG